MGRWPALDACISGVSPARSAVSGCGGGARARNGQLAQRSAGATVSWAGGRGSRDGRGHRGRPSQAAWAPPATGRCPERAQREAWV